MRQGRALPFVGIAVAAATLASCGGLLKAPADLDRDARAFMVRLQQSRLDSVLTTLQVEGDRDTVRARLQQGRDFIGPYAVDSAELVGWNVVTMDDTRGTLTYEAHAGPQWALLSVDLVRSGSASRITGFRWEATSRRLADLNAFSLGGRGVVHYLYLLLAVTSVVTCVGGAIFAGIKRMGILWVLFCLVGIGKATINWTTGGQAFNPASFQLLGAGYFRPGMVGPWFISWSLPLGTILMFLKWRARRSSKIPTEPSVAA